jgi:hypothetical protein
MGPTIAVFVVCQKDKPNSKPVFGRGAGYCCFVDYPDIGDRHFAGITSGYCYFKARSFLSNQI